jgi:hypothetical protein
MAEEDLAMAKVLDKLANLLAANIRWGIFCYFWGRKAAPHG